MYHLEVLGLVVVLLAGSSSAYIVKDGNCSLVSANIPVLDNFNLEKVGECGAIKPKLWTESDNFD